jgi:hypothetical protein
VLQVKVKLDLSRRLCNWAATKEVGNNRRMELNRRISAAPKMDWTNPPPCSCPIMGLGRCEESRSLYVASFFDALFHANA